MKKIKMAISTKVTLMVVAATILCLGIGFAVLGTQRIGELRQNRLDTATTLAKIVGDYAMTSLAFQDADDGKSVLKRLREHPDVLEAVLYTNDRRSFAEYRKSEEEGNSPRLAPSPFEDLQKDRLQVAQKISFEGKTYGTIYLILSTADLQNQIDEFLFTLLLLVAVLAGLALLVGFFLQRFVSEPLSELTKVAEAVSEDRGNQPRADIRSSDEIGILSDGFNAMLDRLDSRAKELSDTNHMVRGIIEASPLAIIGVDTQERVTLWNREAERVFNIQEEEALGVHLAKVVDEHVFDAVMSAKVDPWVRERSVELKRGEDDHSLRLSISDSDPNADDYPGIVIVVADETERIKTAHALADTEKQLQRAQKMEAVGRLAGSVSHDFNNLLTVIFSETEMLKEQSQSGDVLRSMRVLERVAARGSALIRRLLVFCRPQTVVPEVADIDEIIAELEHLFLSVLGEHVRLKILPSDDLIPLVVIDIGQIEQVLLNIILNARDAMPNGGLLKVQTHVDQGSGESPSSYPSVSISVTDTGIGMKEDVMKRVFEPFFTTKEHGTGLGLNTSQKIVSQFGGKLLVDSTPNKGTTFTLQLPLAEGRTKQITVPDPSPIKVQDNKGRILLVDDDDEVRGATQRMLSLHGFEVLAAKNGIEALCVLEEQRGAFDLILSDVVMPEMSGLDLVQKIRGRWPRLRMLFTSGHLGDNILVKRLGMGSDSFIAKPFSSTELLAKIQVLVGHLKKEKTDAPLEDASRPSQGS